MSYKANPSQKTHCERHQKRVKISSNHVRPCSSTVSKNRSTGTLNNKTNIVKPKKTTKSDCIVGERDEQGFTPAKLNNCQACGDAIQNTTQKKKSNVFISMNGTRNSGGVQQYFRNKNFRQSSASIYGAETLKKGSNLNTINEQSEENLRERAISETIYGNSSDAEDCDGKTALEDIEELKKFRRENYFECHSAAAKLKGSASVTSLKDHKCVYRFYLNDRLFPVPVRADYNNVIRCTGCHLPLEGPHQNDNISGTIQAKVKVNGQLQYTTLILPVRKSLIIKERRKEVDRKEEDPLYFGIVRLSRDGDSVFHRNLPSDSLALRYQKGYQKRVNNNKYEYGRVRNDEVIII